MRVRSYERFERTRQASGGLSVLVVVAVLALGLVAGTVEGQDRRPWSNNPSASSTSDDGPPGRWRRAREGAGEGEIPELTPEQAAEIERLESLGYLSGSQPAPATSGVTVYDHARAYDGLNFYTSGHFAGAVLMDMEGRTLHEWRHEFLQTWPGETESAELDGAEYWRWAYLFPNGDVLGIFEGLGLIKVDRNSNLLWEHLGGEHHDLEVTDDGLIYVLTRRAHIVESIDERLPILEDFVTILGSDGRALREVSVLEAFENSVFASAPEARNMPTRGDIYHTNAIEILDGSIAHRIPAFREGNVLLSMRQTSTVAVLDMDLEEIVWVASDLWDEQHDPKVLPNGNIMVFDNKGNQGKSRIVEFEPLTRELVWTYGGKQKHEFYTRMCGANHRLPNGNTIMTESDYGRALEVTPDGTIVWEFLNPHVAGEDGDLIATLFDVVRLDPDFPLDWLE